MKLRDGFVSNSSSSSFVVAIKKQETCQHCGHQDFNILDAIDNSYSDSRVVHQGLKETLQYLEESLGDYGLTPQDDPAEQEEWDREPLLEYRKLRDQDWTQHQVAVVSIDHNDLTIQYILDHNDNIEIISGEGQ